MTRKIRKFGLTKGLIDDNGRECTICKEYKPRSEYHKSKIGVYNRTNNCISCRKKLKHEYRKLSNQDNEYKKSKRKPPIGSKIGLINYIHYDTMGNPREVTWTITDYQYKKGHTLINKEYGLSLKVCFGDNKTSRKYYYIEEIEKQEEEKTVSQEYNNLPC